MPARKVSIEIDEDLVRRARVRSLAAAASDSEVIATTVAAYLGFQALAEAHALGGLAEDEADQVATAELRAMRAQRGRATDR